MLDRLHAQLRARDHIGSSQPDTRLDGEHRRDRAWLSAGDFADASLDTSSIAFVLDCHVWSNNSVRVTARNVSASTVDLTATPLSVLAPERRVPSAR